MKSQHLTLSIAVGSLILMALPVLYFLSLGPVVWWHAHYTIPEPWITYLAILYLPLDFLAEQNELVMAVLEWYQELWMLLV